MDNKIDEWVERVFGDPPAKKFIGRAIKRKGSLTKWAHEHGFVKNDGNIDLSRAREYAERHDLTRRIKQISQAKTLKRLRR